MTTFLDPDSEPDRIAGQELDAMGFNA